MKEHGSKLVETQDQASLLGFLALNLGFVSADSPKPGLLRLSAREYLITRF